MTSALVIPIAHTEHWLAGILYLMPVFILGAGILWQRHNDKHATEGDTPADDGDVPFTDD